MILAIDPGNKESAYVLMGYDLEPVKFGKVANEVLLNHLKAGDLHSGIKHLALEMVACYGMPVGKEVFDTCVWIGRFLECTDIEHFQFIYRKDEKMNLCNSMKAKDGNIIQALIDRFAYGVPNKGKGTKKDPGYFYGFKADIWQAYAVGVTYADLYL